MGAEALELWVMPVASGPPAQYCLRKQCFAPQGDQTLWIEIAGMYGPNSQNGPA